MTLSLKFNPNQGMPSFSLQGGIASKNTQFQYLTIQSAAKASEGNTQSAGLNSSGSEGSDTVEVSAESQKVGKLLELSTIESFISITKSATDSVANLRSKQLSLAQEATTLAVSEQRTRINDEIATLETEIARVAESASFNGHNAFSESITLATGDNRLIISLGRATSADTISIDVTSDSGASTAVTTLTNAVITAQNTSSNTQAALDKTEIELNEALNSDLEIRRQSSDKIDSIEGARGVAIEITKQLLDPYAREKNEAQVLENGLDAVRVSALLGDG